MFVWGLVVGIPAGAALAIGAAWLGQWLEQRAGR